MFDTDLTPSTPSHIAFTGNPIILRDDFDLSTQALHGYPFNVELNGVNIYTGRFNYPYSINIANIINSFIDYLPEPDARQYVDSGPLIRIESPEEFARRFVFVQFNGEYDREFAFYALPGGVSRQNLNWLSGMSDRDIFTCRFLAKNTNCFLSSRTNGWSITIKETEIYPLYFINDNWDDEFTIVEKLTGKSLTIDCIDPGVYALDIEALRRKFFDEHGLLANSFEVFHQGQFACRIVIEQAELSKERYRLKFRNSLGVFEIIEVTGELTVNPEWSGDDDATFSIYNPITDGYVSTRERVGCKRRLSISSRVKHPDEILFLMDMLSSDEVYLLDMSPSPVRVIPTTEELSFKLRPDVPSSFNLFLDLVEDEAFILPDIFDTSDFRRPKVFTKQFTKQFN